MTGCQRRSVSLSSSKLPLCHGNVRNSRLPRSGLRGCLERFPHVNRGDADERRTLIRSAAPPSDRRAWRGVLGCNTPRARLISAASATAANVSGSCDVTPNSKLVIRRANPRAAITPIHTPTSASFAPCLRTMLHHVSALRSKRQTNSNFALTLRNGVRDDAVDADDAQRHRHRARDSQHH